MVFRLLQSCRYFTLLRKCAGPGAACRFLKARRRVSCRKAVGGRASAEVEEDRIQASDAILEPFHLPECSLMDREVF